MTFRGMFAPAFRELFGETPVSALTTLFYDTFTGADGTALTAHTPDINTAGGGWTAFIGTQEIRGNRLRAKTLPGSLSSAYANSAANVVITAAVYERDTSWSSAGVVGRLQDSANYWVSYVNRAATGRHVLFERTGGTYTVRATANFTLPAVGTRIDITFTLNGTSLQSVLSGGATSAISYTSSQHQSNTRHGVEFDNYTTKDIDDYTVVAA